MKKGSKVIFQMHYTADGREHDDRSFFGVQYADPKDVDYRVYVTNAINFTFTIQPTPTTFPSPPRARSTRIVSCLA